MVEMDSPVVVEDQTMLRQTTVKVVMVVTEQVQLVMLHLVVQVLVQMADMALLIQIEIPTEQAHHKVLLLEDQLVVVEVEEVVDLYLVKEDKVS